MLDKNCWKITPKRRKFRGYFKTKLKTLRMTFNVNIILKSTRFVFNIVFFLANICIL